MFSANLAMVKISVRAGTVSVAVEPVWCGLNPGRNRSSQNRSLVPRLRQLYRVLPLLRMELLMESPLPKKFKVSLITSSQGTIDVLDVMTEFTMLRKLWRTELTGTSDVYDAPFVENPWTLPLLPSTARKSIANPATANSLGRKDSAMVRELAHFLCLDFLYFSYISKIFLR